MMADERQVTGPVSEDLFDDGDMDAMFGDSDPGAVSRVLAFREAGGENDDGAPAPGAPASLAERGRSNSISSLDGITVKTSDNVDLVKAFEFIVTSIVHAGQGRDAALNFTGNKRYGSKQDTNFDVTKFDGLADAGRELHMRSIIESARNGHLAELVGVGKLLRDFWLFVVCGKSVKALGYLGLERNSKQIISKNGRKNAVASFLMQLYNDVGRLYGVKASMSVTEVMKAGMRGRNTAAKKIALTFSVIPQAEQAHLIIHHFQQLTVGNGGVGSQQAVGEHDAGAEVERAAEAADTHDVRRDLFEDPPEDDSSGDDEPLTGSLRRGQVTEKDVASILLESLGGTGLQDRSLSPESSLEDVSLAENSFTHLLQREPTDVVAVETPSGITDAEVRARLQAYQSSKWYGSRVNPIKRALGAIIRWIKRRWSGGEKKDYTFNSFQRIAPLLAEQSVPSTEIQSVVIDGAAPGETATGQEGQWKINAAGSGSPKGALVDQFDDAHVDLLVKQMRDQCPKMVAIVSGEASSSVDVSPKLRSTVMYYGARLYRAVHPDDDSNPYVDKVMEQLRVAPISIAPV